jgi:hypothetical protein
MEPGDYLKITGIESRPELNEVVGPETRLPKAREMGNENPRRKPPDITCKWKAETTAPLK